ncbi:hypothetical protein T484DRAFT_1955699, partial [Baffinella frigidus]
RQRRTCYALCHLLYPVSAAHTSIFRMDSNSNSLDTRHQPDHKVQRLVQRGLEVAARDGELRIDCDCTRMKLIVPRKFFRCFELPT